VAPLAPPSSGAKHHGDAGAQQGHDLRLLYPHFYKPVLINKLQAPNTALYVPIIGLFQIPPHKARLENPALQVWQQFQGVPLAGCQSSFY